MFLNECTVMVMSFHINNNVLCLLRAPVFFFRENSFLFSDSTTTKTTMAMYSRPYVVSHDDGGDHEEGISEKLLNYQSDYSENTNKINTLRVLRYDLYGRGLSAADTIRYWVGTRG